MVHAFKDFLVNISFKNSYVDASLFFFRACSQFVYILFYVDDIIIMENASAEIRRVLDLLAVKFSFKDIGELTYFFGMETHRSPDGLMLTDKVHDWSSSKDKNGIQTCCNSYVVHPVSYP